MNGTFLLREVKIGDVIRLTTDHAVGVIGKVKNVDIANNGIALEEVKDPTMAEQIENPMAYDKALFPISDIKYIFILDLTKKSNEFYGTNDSQSKIQKNK